MYGLQKGVEGSRTCIVSGLLLVLLGIVSNLGIENMGIKYPFLDWDFKKNIYVVSSC